MRFPLFLIYSFDNVETSCCFAIVNFLAEMSYSEEKNLPGLALFTNIRKEFHIVEVSLCT